MSNDFIKEWAEKVDWKTRVKSVCKPCWELKYCPYGPLVEDFPLESDPSEKSCRIFGHNCPVFYVAEPITETKELRNISRAIPSEIKFKVIARDKNICQICGKNIFDDEVQFDHIIPYSKGGATEVSNIRLLCPECNQKRSNNFENEFLVNDCNEFFTESLDIDTIEMYLSTVQFYQYFKNENKQAPTKDDYLEDDDYETAEFIEERINTFISLFDKNEYDITPKMFSLLKDRWGLIDSKVKPISELDLTEQERQDLFYSEIRLFSCTGVYLKRNKNSYKKWCKQIVEE